MLNLSCWIVHTPVLVFDKIFNELLNNVTEFPSGDTSIYFLRVLSQ